jgi:hypothetical protein
MSKITLVKADGNRFIPAYDSDWQMARKIKTGAIITVSFVKERNILLHKKFFSLINLVFDNQEIYTNIDDLRKDLTIEAGFYEEVSNMFTGEVYRKAKSINFSSMLGAIAVIIWWNTSSRSRCLQNSTYTEMKLFNASLKVANLLIDAYRSLSLIGTNCHAKPLYCFDIGAIVSILWIVK